MFGLDLNDFRESVRSVLDAQVRIWGGLAFMALAMVAIQYDEVVAPKVHGFSDTFSTAATDVGRRLSSFTL